MTTMPSWRDLPIGAVITRPGSSVEYQTGDWRTLRPVYEEKTPPCNDACPTGIKVQGFQALALEGKFLEAWQLIKEDSPFPRTCGRVCFHPCETACNRGQFDEPLANHLVERFIGDYVAQHGHAPLAMGPRQDKKVAVVGSGPAGLACAYHLARRGYPVTVFEALPEPGGMMRVAIPEYRLPKAVLDAEIEEIKALGVEIRTNTKVDSVDELLDGGYDAVFLGLGAHQNMRLGAEGEDSPGVIDCLSFLRQVNAGNPPQLGDKVVVIGGGNVAIDCARCARRLGAKDVSLAFPETREQMPAFATEVEEAEREGIVLNDARSVLRIATQDGRASGVELVSIRGMSFDAEGRLVVDAITASEHTLAADTVIVAIGQTPDPALAAKTEGVAVGRRGRIVVEPQSMVTGRVAVFAGGDVVSGPASVTEALGAGKRAALAIAAYLSGEPLAAEPKPPVVSFEELNTVYFERQPRRPERQLPLDQRVPGFAEVNLGYTEADIKAEAERCFSCGVCNDCGNCWIYCPDGAVLTQNGEVEGPDLDYCKGCGICAQECPRNYIRMIMELEAQESKL